MTTNIHRAAAFGLACLVSVVPACIGNQDPGSTSSADAAAPELDPTGNWNLTYTFAAACGTPVTTTPSTFTVTRGSDGWQVAIAGVDSMGTLLCSADACKLSGVFTWSGGGANFQQNANIVMDMHGGITGSGTEAVIRTTGTCSYTFSVLGLKS